jgi:hypothetical protein
VLGAGASYDSVPSRNPKRFQGIHDRLPLANELFDDRPDFSQAMARFPQCHPIIPLLRDLPADRTVEQVLASLQSEAAHYPQGHRQLAAVRYYLQFMLSDCENRWNAIAWDITNYKTLLDQIERWRKPDDQVCLVTFNYDRMIEGALPVLGVNIKGLEDYIAGPRYKLVKLHGSVNWGRMIDSDSIPGINELNAFEAAYLIIERFPDLKVTKNFHLENDQRPISKVGNTLLFPAIAIPVETKQHYECPDEHVAALREFIPKTTKLLMIGWRATDNRFLSLLSEGIPDDLRVMSVAGTHDAAKQSVKNLRDAGIRALTVESEGGFSDFIVNREGDEFLRS